MVANNTSQCSKSNNEALRNFEQPQLLTRMTNWGPSYIGMLKMELGSLGKFNQPQFFTGMLDWGPSYMAPLEMGQGSLGKIQTAISFDRDARFRSIIYHNSQNETSPAKISIASLLTGMPNEGL